MSEWRQLFKAVQPVDPDWPPMSTPPASITLWLDNLGGLMLGMESAAGKRVILPVSDGEATDLAIALMSRSSVDGAR